ncbi:MAG: leucyl aminopeptidase [Granulosicoccus sp.]|nr:leucyl aminopeptidase [Granulosicoccus sp.]
MQIKIEKRLPSSTENSCQLLFLFDDGKFPGSARKINTQSQQLLKSLYSSGDFTGRAGQTLLLHQVEGCTAQRLLLIGLGEKSGANSDRWLLACRAAAKVINDTPTENVVCDSTANITIGKLQQPSMAQHLSRELLLGSYRFSMHHRSTIIQSSPISKLTLIASATNLQSVKVAAERGKATAMGMATARDLGNLAPNICTPDYLAEKAAAVCDQFDNLSHEILDESAMEELGMGAFLAVSKGSAEPGKLICMNYRGRKRAGSPIVLIGKGITFDTGGISIKPSESLDEMKYDMCGAATVFGVIEAVARLQLDINVVGLVAAAENMPGGNATRPGDVVVSMSGQSIEILNTDAEGRLVLCDTLTYAERYKPAAVIDIATLTGACVVALGKSRSGVMGNHQDTVDQLVRAGYDSGDLAWQLPIGDDYQNLLDSNFADMANIGGRPAGAITAACFLSRFAKSFSWAHMDIAGVASISGKTKGATGRPVPLLMSFLFSRVDS